jgi:hypothetical protein
MVPRVFEKKSFFVFLKVSSSTTSPTGGIVDSFRSIVKKEGIRSLWRGNLVAVIHKGPYGALNYYTYEGTKVYLLRSFWISDMDPGIAVRFGSGFVAGAIASFFTYPLDIVRTRMAINVGDTILSTMAKIIKSEGGLRALGKGLPATVACQSSNLAVNFAIYESLQVKVIKIEKQLAEKWLGSQYVTTRQRGSWASSLVCGTI